MAPRSLFSVDWIAENSPSNETGWPRRGVVDLPLPRGLLSGWTDPIWTFSTLKATGIHSIRWDRRLPDGNLLTDKKHAGLLETARRFLTILIEDPADCFSMNGHETALHRTTTLLSIIEWIVGLGHERISQAKQDEWLSFRRNVPFGLDYAKGSAGPRKSKLTDARILEIFRVCQALHVFQIASIEGSSLLEDGLIFPPFGSWEDPVSLARLLGRKQKRTPSIPSSIALHCLDASIQYIMYYSDDLIRLHEKTICLRKAESGRSKRRPPGELLHEVRLALLGHLQATKPLQVTEDCRVVRVALARQLNTHPSSLCDDEIAKLLVKFEETLAQWDPPAEEELVLLLAKQTSEWVPRRSKSQLRGPASLLGLPFSGRPGSAAPWPLEAVGSSPRNGNKMTLERAIANLWTSIFIVYDTFMSDRIGECLNVEADCIKQGLDGFYVRSPFYKQTNAQAGQSNERACPRIVAKAVEAAVRLGAEARQELGTNKLFAAIHRLGATVLDETTIRHRLSAFARDVGAPKSEDGTDWRLAPHQIRRFLPNAWVWYFDLGPGLDALRQHLRHEDITMTMRYCADDLGEIATEEQRELTASVLERSIYEGLDVLGPFGKRWKRIAARIKISAVDPDQLGDVISEVIEQKEVLLYPQPWGYCAWWRNAAAYAQCLPKEQRNGIRSRPDNQKHAEICAGCINCLLTEAFAPFWIEARARHYATLSRERIPPVLAEAARTGLQISDRMCRELGG